MTPAEALAALAHWREVTDRRDDLIRAAAAVGVTEAQIVAATGLARMTVRKALGK